MRRKVHTSVPQVKEHSIPDWPHMKEFRRLDEKYKREQKQHYDRCHNVRPLPLYVEDD